MPDPPGVPEFAPVRTRRGAHRLRRAVRRRRRALVAGVALTAAALAASGPRAPQDRAGGDTRAGAAGADEGATPPAAGEPAGRPGGSCTAGPAVRTAPGEPTVTVPVRLAEAETVRRLRPGDRVDVIAVPGAGEGFARPPGARVVAGGVRVAGEPQEVPAVRGGGAVVPLAVPRRLAPALAAAQAAVPLAVTVC
ncbi:hypothetical protein ABT354_16295 [Streptomyces sp. NPDC000594]|uniref:hypothetical protein n=1 Tax=Streptomyces sp. NPDC000594 TaxID=3154261 RepID=UPI0033320DB1